jgi:hypothetical protein
VPVIAPNAGVLSEVLQGAAAWTQGWGAGPLAAEMVRLMKDAGARRDLGAAAEARAAVHGPAAAAEALLAALEQGVLRPVSGALAAHAQLCVAASPG